MDALEFDSAKLYGKRPGKNHRQSSVLRLDPSHRKIRVALSPASMLVLTLQHEVAARLNAAERTKDFGAPLTVLSLPPLEGALC